MELVVLNLDSSDIAQAIVTKLIYQLQLSLIMINCLKSMLFIVQSISADDSSDGAQDRMKTKIKVNHNGTNTWLAPSILQSSCKIDVHYFPFDEQVSEH